MKKREKKEKSERWKNREVNGELRKRAKDGVRREMEHKVKISWGFIIALAAVSILGFVGIVSKSLFDLDLFLYIEPSWLIIIGLGLMIEVKMKKLRTIAKQGLNPNNFTHLITMIIAAIAIISGILSFPFAGIENPGFIATKGIVSIIAIVIIIVQTWIVK